MEEGKRCSILLVDDDEAACEILGNVFSIKFPEITFLSAGDGTSGLESFKRHSPAMVITDVNMPFMDGICMAREIKAIDPEVKLVALTAFSARHVLESSLAVGVEIDHCIMKPLEFDKLFVLVEQHLAALFRDEACKQLDCCRTGLNAGDGGAEKRVDT